MSRSPHAGGNRERFTALVGALVACLAGPACGGEAAQGSAGMAGTTATRLPTATEARGAGGAPEASGGSACDAVSGLSASLVWEGPGYDGYEFSPGYFGFSPDGLELESPGRMRSAYDVQTGAVLGTQGLTVAFRDRGWTREVVGGQVLEVASRGVLLNVSATSAAALSGDGRYFFWLDGSCVAGALNVHRQSVDSQEQRVLPLSGFCDGGSQPTLTVTATGSAALAATGSGQLWHADFERGQSTSLQVHGAAANSRSGLSVALSPDERFVAVLGADQRLRTFSYPEFEPVLADLPAAFTYAFSWCYCRSMWFAPVAWSADGSLLAAADENGHVVVRRACDGRVLATLDSPAPRYPAFSPPHASELGPMYLAFAPNGAELAVSFEWGLHYFALGGLGE